ncbi:monosaccharide ABC transporter ATP-binding protein, CUT2 family [Raineyella antarctica]|uniref:Monosaccharide ABC transporter ATP-binding protein, CUT2 family n=1 Tax=Raineyella antarctica TaxID=1577474 RepID=A0A1G6GIR5_9ACTN|nr:sugar ABC transporter ATP-binding protein [Raineyella antarctica]SDB81809.1 monosaccharide ABC transporter ATP-binding protein, CUT2 family [Raineyella antarctica]
MSDPTPVLSLDGVSKRFGPVTVVDHVSVNLYPGKVTALLGENGAGKSTVIKMMCGVYQPDGGRILVDGKETVIPDTRTAEAHGIATIHQELNLAPNMSVAENVMLGRTPSAFGLVRRGELRRRAKQALDRIGLDVDLDRPVGTLGVARQQLVEIAKALAVDARILILDEPTAALTGREIRQLFDVVEELRAKGVAMAFISHHLEEIAEIGDTVTVLRDGRFVGEVPATTEQDELIRMMVGRDIEDQFPRHRSDPGEVLLKVDGLTAEGRFRDVSFEVRAGEVLGMAGLVGAGRTEVVRAIAGADDYEAGTVELLGRRLPKHRVTQAIARGIGHVPEDRKAEGLVLGGTVEENLGYATLWSTGHAGLADRRGQRRRADEVSKRLRVRLASLDQPVRDLSGGNQQKVVFGRWVQAHSRVLLLDEPTRGVDVGAKVEIYELINQVTDNGGAVVMVSSELPEVLGMSDRILVMSRGRVAGELPAEGATQDRVMALAVSAVEPGRATDLPQEGIITASGDDPAPPDRKAS